MMSINFSCPGCGKTYRVKDEMAGKTAHCACGKQIKIPTQKSNPTTDLIGLLEESAPALPKNKQASPASKTKRTPASSAFAQFGNRLSKSARSALIKVALGGAAGACVAIVSVITNQGDVQSHGAAFQIAAVLAFMAIGAGAAGLLIIADTVGKRSRAARWLTLLGLMVMIIAGVIGYFLWEAYQMDKARHTRRTANDLQQFPTDLKNRLTATPLLSSLPKNYPAPFGKRT
jgi:hypothetical protein